MKKKLMAIGGEPATGKTTLMKSFLRSVPQDRKRLNLLLYHFVPSLGLSVFGKYGDELFDGTDKLSMAVQPDAERFLELRMSAILFEGDRLFNLKFLEKARRLYDCRFVLLESAESEISRRHKSRGDSQTERFIKSRKTKLQNLERAGIVFERWRSASIADLEENTKKIRDFFET